MLIPHLESTLTGKQLIVNGEPFLMLAGELQNSSLSSAHYMRSVWSRLKEANINTILGAVTWEQIEPQEGEFDFENLDQVIVDARSYSLHLVLLWFGSFKNALSTYAPGWVKINQKRFPRAKIHSQDGLETADTVSVFSSEAQNADATAFRKLMEHIKEVDEQHSTVIMVQVENEVGLRGDSRDRSSFAEAAFNTPVPEDIISYLYDSWDKLHPLLKSNLKLFKEISAQSRNRNSSWSSVFGCTEQTDEIFMAYHYAKYLEKVAAAGKAVYPIPLYTNVWQNYKGEDSDKNFKGTIVAGGGSPGQYPSGGGVANVLDIWQHYAKSLDFIAPDIYLNEYESSCAKYRHQNQPLFIPEQRRDEYGARRIWTAFGTYAALGTSPFGIDSIEPDINPFKKHYGLLERVKKHVLAAQRTPNSSIGFYFDDLFPDGTDTSPAFTTSFGEWNIRVERSFVFGRPGPGFGMIVFYGNSRFLLIGEGYQLVFSSKDSKKRFTGILSFREKEVIDSETGELITRRILNGDETRSGKFVIMPGTEPDYGGFPICVTIPARTRIAEVEVYALECENVDN